MPEVNISFTSGDDLDAAQRAAKAADVAIVFAYQWEAESFDLPTLDLAPEQNKLIESVANANPKTVVVLETGSPATMPWSEKVQGIIEAWYPGIRGGKALAEILTGKANPSAKLAITFPKSDADLPHPKLEMPPASSEPNFSAAGNGPVDFLKVLGQGLPPFQTHYDEGLKVGYKWYDAEKKPVLFPFGFGLSYTTFAYSDLTVRGTEALAVSFTIRNTGKRAGTEITEVYASLPDAAGEPPRRLIGWSRIQLAPGESKQVSIPVDRERLSIYDESSNRWKLVPGQYTIFAGSSSRELLLNRSLELR